jgi:hypothetical protein
VIRGFLTGLCVLSIGLPAAARTMEPYDTAVVRVLDKGTARVEQIEIPVGKPMVLGHIQIDLRSCQQTPAEEEPEAAAFMVIGEIKPGAPEAILFRGWMFASNPSLSALEHPLYDVWVISCKNLNAKASSVLPVLPSAVPPSNPAAPLVAVPAANPGKGKTH